MARFYLTTPIYYVNDRPHIGHAYTTVAADVLARYHRSLGTDVFFLTGVDEHGQKVEKAAGVRGIAAQAHCDEFAERFRSLWELLGIAPDGFLRTTDAGHKAVVTRLLSQLHERGHIELREFEGWYCTPCERYWTEKDLVAGHCPDCQRPVELLREKNYFFLMSRFAERARDAIVRDEYEVLPHSRKNEILAFYDRGVGDLCISRTRQRLQWGIPLPFDPDYVTYVWMDALVNYISGPEYLGSGGVDRWPADLHLIGKDILTQHAVYWPTILLALDLPLPRRLVAHGWWNFSGAKMSKSIGNVVDPRAVVEMYAEEAGTRASVEALRWFLMAEVTFGLDGVFSLDAFERRWTADLSNDIGNLASRVVSLIGKVCEGRVTLAPETEDIAAMSEYGAAMEQCQFSRAAEVCVRLAHRMNLLLQERQPWRCAPDAPTVLGRAAASLRFIAWMLYPFAPESARLLSAALGIGDPSVRPDPTLTPHIAVKELQPLFLRPRSNTEHDHTETSKPALLKETSVNPLNSSTPPAAAAVPAIPSASAVASAAPVVVGAVSAVSAPASAPASAPPVVSPNLPVSVEDVKKLGLRVGVVTAAERVPKTDRLLKLTVDLGTETRTLVAGIAAAYEPEQVVGQRVVVVTNLAPAKIRGIESRGMVLAAADGLTVSLVSPLGAMPAGSEVR